MKTEFNFYLIAIKYGDGNIFDYVQHLENGGTWELKQRADKYMATLDHHFRNEHMFAVIVTKAEIAAGDAYDPDSMKPCFQLL